MMNATLTPGIARLLHAERSGDWHDKPLRYIVTVPENTLLTQKFSTLKDAQTWVSCVRRGGGDWRKTSDLFTATWNH